MLHFEGRVVARNQAEGARLIALAARAGDPDAQYRGALMYGSGVGAKQNTQLAVEWLRKAAKVQPDAQYMYAAIISKGLYGVKQDDAAAVAWLRRSARQGNAEAQYALGLVLAEGRGVDKDAQQSLFWITEAAKNGSKRAVEDLARAKDRLPREGTQSTLPWMEPFRFESLR
jgi:TPR repeat protein